MIITKNKEGKTMGFFDKLKEGLKKTKDSFNDKVDGVFKVFKRVDDELFDELEEALIEADVGVQTSMEIIERLREAAKKERITESEELSVKLREIIAELMEENDEQTPETNGLKIILVIGVNGVGKTTSIGKLANKFKSEGKKVMLAAADTFRAAAIDQLMVWADRCGVDIIKHEEGSDPASVVFDAVSAAKARGVDVLIVDTAGRLHNKKNLMEELKKILKVADREAPGALKQTLLVLDATTGQNALSQAKLFGEIAEIDGIILTKLDGTAKGGVVIAICNEQRLPVKYIGVGEGIDDLQDFSASDFVKALF
ncbi:MAG: signal recognition particle-docking protein FtsY [Ruminococcaceae bacterium]|nr:signal recognition particle-docking protein FtsY [Oscillospiraceae bacterium]